MVTSHASFKQYNFLKAICIGVRFEDIFCPHLDLYISMTKDISELHISIGV